jgi:hypothetical protein
VDKKFLFFLCIISCLLLTANAAAYTIVWGLNSDDPVVEGTASIGAGLDSELENLYSNCSFFILPENGDSTYLRLFLQFRFITDIQYGEGYFDAFSHVSAELRADTNDLGFGPIGDTSDHNEGYFELEAWTTTNKINFLDLHASTWADNGGQGTEVTSFAYLELWSMRAMELETGGLTGEFSYILPPPSPVPEPATILLFSTGFVGLAAASRRRMKKAQGNFLLSKDRVI